VAPAGYAEYSSGPIGQVSLKRVRGVARWVSILVIVTGVMSFVDLLVRRTVTDEADQYLAGEMSAREFTDAIIGYSVVPVISFLFQIATLVLAIVWMFRVAANHRALHRGGTWGPGWAIAGWVLPPFVFVIPTLMTVELWKASDPDVAIGGDWRSGRASPLPVIWGLLYSGAWILSLGANADSSFTLSEQEKTLAEGITADPTLDIVVAVLMLAAAIAFAMLVRQITARHIRLTGEARS
jgi:hypothetical protein